MNMKAIFALMKNAEAAVKIRTKKNSGLYRIWTHDHGDNGVVLYQLG